jgi:hypothetical protein
VSYCIHSLNLFLGGLTVAVNRSRIINGSRQHGGAAVFFLLYLWAIYIVKVCATAERKQRGCYVAAQTITHGLVSDFNYEIIYT